MARDRRGLRVFCLMMQKDEDVLLDVWCAYYGQLFGPESLVIFDNGSTSEAVIASLRRQERAGSRVVWHHRSHADFVAKGNLFADYVRRLDREEDYDFAILCDCDELIACFSGTRLTCGRDAVREHLSALRGTPSALLIRNTWFNSPARPGWFVPEFYPKCLFARGTIAFVDHGFHLARSTNGETQETELTHIHLHNKSFAAVRAHAAAKLQGFIDVSSITSETQYDGFCFHLIKYFQMTEADYVHQYDDRPQLYLPEIVSRLVGVGVDVASVFGGEPETRPEPPPGTVWLRLPAPQGGVVAFDPDAYLARYPDLRGDLHPSQAIIHFMSQGWSEGRWAGPSAGQGHR